MSNSDLLLRAFPASLVAAAAVAFDPLAEAQTFSGSDSVFAPGTWSVSVKGTNPAQTGSGEQTVNGYAPGVNAWTSSVSPNGTADTWTISIFEGFAYNPSANPGEPASVTVSFDSRWITTAFSRVGPAMRQGSTVWAGYHDLNSTTWATYSYSGWSTLINGASALGPDFSAGAAPIFFGFYQRNGNGGLKQSEFANFAVSVVVPSPAAVSILLAFTAPGPSRRRRMA